MGHKWNQGNVPGTLNCNSQCSLMLRANAGAAARFDLGPVGHESTNFVDVLVINDLDVFHAESAHTPTGNEPSPRPSTGSSARPSTSRASRRTPAWRSGGTPTLGRVRRPVGCFGSHRFIYPSKLLSYLASCDLPRMADRQFRRRVADHRRRSFPGLRRSCPVRRSHLRRRRRRFRRGGRASASRWR